MKRASRHFFRSSVLALSAALLLTAVAPSSAHAQSIQRVDARALNWNRLHTEITVDFDDNRLEDVFAFIRDYSGADLEPLWIDEKRAGLDRDREVSLSVEKVATLTLIERVLEQVQDHFDPNAWQFSRSGALELGPKSRLNGKAYLKVYDVNDLLYEIPNFPDTPALDLDQILNQSQQGGGGGGGSIFQEEDVDEKEGPTREELIEQLEDLIVSNVEPEQWVRTAGDGASIRFYEGHFLIRAPSYIHRQIVEPRFMRVTPRQTEVPTARRPVYERPDEDGSSR